MARGPYLELEQLLGEARRVAGCDDWGSDDWKEPFALFLRSLNAEAELTPQGIERTKSHILKMLIGRLRLFNDRKVFPALANEQISAPVFLTGQGRSGTSHLYALLACDPQSCVPSHWQIWTLSPPPGLPSSDNGPQIAAGQHYIQFEGWQDPDLRSKHDYDNAGPAEDTLIQDFTFASRTFSFFWNVPSYAAWLANADIAAAYRFERKVLQALQFGRTCSQWVLKSPIHLSQLTPLFGEFPDARIVVTHRDPVKCLGSVMSLLGAHRKQFGNAPVAVDRSYALMVMEDAAATLEDLIRRRRDPEFDKRFVDVKYLDLEQHPIRQVEEIYRRLGVGLKPEARAAMERYGTEHRKGKFGLHRYRLEDAGLRVEEVRDRFRFYTDHFNIPLENGGDAASGHAPARA